MFECAAEYDVARIITPIRLTETRLYRRTFDHARREYFLQVLVRDNNIDQALRVLKKKMQREGVFREMKRRRFYEKPSERSAREQNEALRRARKLARKKAHARGCFRLRPARSCWPASPGGAEVRSRSRAAVTYRPLDERAFWRARERECVLNVRRLCSGASARRHGSTTMASPLRRSRSSRTGRNRRFAAHGFDSMLTAAQFACGTGHRRRGAGAAAAATNTM